MRYHNYKKILSYFVSMFFVLWNVQTVSANNIIRDPEIESVVYSVVNPLLRQIGKAPKEVSIYIIADPAINAFVQGGQNIFIHTGLLIALKNQNQLAAVLAHELGHITGGHLLKSSDAMSDATTSALITGAAVGLAAALSGGGGDAVAGALLAGGQAGAGTLNAFTRTQESSADQASISILQKANINPNAMIDVLKMLSKNERGASNYMRSHPLSLDRIENLQYSLKKQFPTQKKYYKFDNLAYQRMQAKLYGFLENPQNTLIRYDNPLNGFDKISVLIANASSYHRLGQAQKALDNIQEAIKLYPNDAFVYDLAGQIALENGKLNDAIAFYYAAYEKSNRNSLIGLAYAQVLVATEDKKNLKKAIPILKLSLLDEHQYAKGYRDLSIAYDRLGNEGLAAASSAEYFLLLKDYNMAMNQARKSLMYLKENQPEALRSRDILFFVEKTIGDNQR
jgi:predicted Zn-dependent protease